VPTQTSRALATGEIDEINYVVPVTDAFGQANQGATTAEALSVGFRISELSRDAKRRFSITLAVAFGCPYAGEVSEGRLAEVVTRAAELAPDELALANTIGCAVPTQVRRRIRQTYKTWHGRLRMHFHETRRTRVANVDAALDAGVRILDASAGGIGGVPVCPWRGWQRGNRRSPMDAAAERNAHQGPDRRAAGHRDRR
jgi:hydroxymethylglutaryl-CoA lyase